MTENWTDKVDEYGDFDENYQDSQADLHALDFSTDQPEDACKSDSLDFLSADNGVADSDNASGVGALPTYETHESDESTTELDGLDSLAVTPEEPDDPTSDHAGLFTISNPSESVLVSAGFDGEVVRIELSAKAVCMGERELAEEILVIAGLARQKSLAGQRTGMLGEPAILDTMRRLGADDTEVLRDFVSMPGGLNLPTEEQAASAQAETFATRYSIGERY